MDDDPKEPTLRDESPDPAARPGRRAILAGALAAPFVWTGPRAFAADQITAADMGGAPAAAIRKAFYEPFERETGIRVVGVVHESDPTAQFKVIMDSGTYLWDACVATPANVGYLSAPKNYLDTLGIAPEEAPTLIPGALTPTWLGFSVFATILAVRGDRFGGDGPKTWADYWNVAKYPGRRALYKGCTGVIEAALMADGVPASALYPLDVERAFRSLDRIKTHVAVWWTSGAQNTQLLQSGEVDATDTWGARAYAAMESGAPVRMMWNQGLYSMDGWCIPKGTPRLDLARKFIRFVLRPEQQAVYSSTVANGPTNLKAYDTIPRARAEILPTYPENLKGLVRADPTWWIQYGPATIERYQDWLLS